MKKKNPISSINALPSKSIKNKVVIEQSWAYWLTTMKVTTRYGKVWIISVRGCCKWLLIGLELILGFWGGFKKRALLWRWCREEVGIVLCFGNLKIFISKWEERSKTKAIIDKKAKDIILARMGIVDHLCCFDNVLVFVCVQMRWQWFYFCVDPSQSQSSLVSVMLVFIKIFAFERKQQSTSKYHTSSCQHPGLNYSTKPASGCQRLLSLSQSPFLTKDRWGLTSGF